MSDTRLVLLDRAKEALTKAATVDEVKEIRDKAEALRMYAKQSGDTLEMQNRCAEIKLRAERRAGELIADKQPKAGRPKRNGSTVEPFSLESLGVTKKQSHRWQRLASVPEKRFDAFIAERIDGNSEITTRDALCLAKSLKKSTRKNAVIESASGSPTITKDLATVAGKKFGCVYADPPWLYGNQATRAATSDHYSGMTVDEICALPIGELAADRSHLHLWTTNAFIFDARRVMEAWGFEYKSVFVWVKPQMGIGNYWRVSHEFMLLGVRGTLTFANHGQMSWLSSPRGRHSSKPEQVRSIIEKVSPGPYLELFGRSEVDGWTVFGNDISRTLFSKGIQ